MNSTPVRPTSTIRLTALLPPPPTPITLILAPRRAAGSSVSRSSCAPRSSDFFMSPPLKELPENPPQLSRHTAECARAHTRGFRLPVAMCVENQSHRRGEGRAADVVGEPAHL